MPGMTGYDVAKAVRVTHALKAVRTQILAAPAAEKTMKPARAAGLIV
jgi:hypothetical protein